MPSRTKKPPAKIITSIKDLRPDAANANRGTARGRAMLETSVRRLGIGRSVLADKNGVLIAGNCATEVIGDVFDNPDVIVVPSDGTKLVVVQRTDLDMTTDVRARELAAYDNRVSAVGLDWDVDALKQLQADGVTLGHLWTDAELAVLFDDAASAEAESTPPEKCCCPTCGTTHKPKTPR